MAGTTDKLALLRKTFRIKLHPLNHHNPEPMLIFDFESERRVFSNPEQVIVAFSPEEVYPALKSIEDANQEGYFAAGYIAYEASCAFINTPVRIRKTDTPLLWFGIFSNYRNNSEFTSGGDFNLSAFRPSVEHHEYRSSIHRIKEAIAKGDTYQVNYTLRMKTEFVGDDLALYQHLVGSVQSKYCAYLNTGQLRILSMSPELFFSKTGNSIVTRPMKGTVNRGRWAEEDEKLRTWLVNSDKNNAENIMIVDLLRNDLGRIAETGTVRVPRLLEIEKYPNVYQLTSTVSAHLPQDTSLTTILEALFPSGSITGAPKISTMSLIQDLEPTPRGIYCGTIGFTTPQRDAIFNVAIRTLVIDAYSGKSEFGTGGGITWDSLEDEEYNEALAKTEIIQNHDINFHLLETLRLENGTYFLLERHLKRIEMSARYLDFHFDSASIRLALKHLADKNSDSQLRVRLMVDSNGKYLLESSRLPETPETLQVVCIADSPINKKDRLLYHKTTQRVLYQEHKKSHPDAFDVLLWNELDEITEFTNGNVVVEINGKKLTPPLDCGLLPGTLRAELIENKVLEEGIILKRDLERADHIWFINSVRKWVKVRLI